LDFYRVASVNDDTPDMLGVEFESPMKSYQVVPGSPAFVIVFDNLFEVFDRGLITPISVTHK